jgi:hydrogenase maturation protease
MNGGTVVIGLGNPLCSDDGAGLEAIRLLREQGVPPEVAVVEGGTPGLGLLDLMAGSERALLVDAVVSGESPGTLHRFTRGELPPREVLPLSMHGVNAIDALSMGELVTPERLPRQVLIFGVEISDRTPGRVGLSSPVAAALPVLVALIGHEL